MKFADRVATYAGRDGCWEWPGAIMSNGYAQTTATISGVWIEHLLVHRGAYMLLVGPIPDGLALDHLCRNRRCFNPAHLEPVTDQTNILRGDAPSAVNARRTQCVNGHEFTPENTLVQQLKGRGPKRRCRECDRIRARQDLERPGVREYRREWWQRNKHRYYTPKAQRPA